MTDEGRRYLAVIPARGGSKGIPRKPLANLAGRPLLDHTISAGLNAARIHGTFVSTEDPEIASRALAAGSGVLRRPSELARDHVAMGPVLIHALEELEERGWIPSMDALWIVLLQPTSPLRTASDIDDAILALEAGRGRGLVSVTEVDREVYKYMTVGEDGCLKGMVSPEAPFMRRQDCPTVVSPNGAIYIYNASAFKEEGGFFFRGVMPYIMPESRSLDIDGPQDLARAEELLSA